MNYLSTQIQPKTNLIIFGILLGKFISHWIITNYNFNMCVFYSLHQINDICNNWWSFCFLVATQVWTHCLALNQDFMLNLLRMLHMLQTSWKRDNLFCVFFFFRCKSQTFPYIMKNIAKFYFIYIWLNLYITHWFNPT